MHTRNVEKSKAHRATDTQAQQHRSGRIMTHHTNKSKKPRFEMKSRVLTAKCWRWKRKEKKTRQRG
jgi:hypothetical protein